MRFVSLNLDLDDATLLRQSLLLSIATCACGSGEVVAGCPTCSARSGLLRELDIVIERADSGVRHRLAPTLAGQDLWIGTGFASSEPAAPELRVIPGGLLDD